MKSSDKIKDIINKLEELKSSTSVVESDIKAIAAKIGYNYKVGDKVALGYARFGVVKEVYTSPITINIDGTDVSKEASQNNPAYLVIEDSGHAVLRLGTEIDSSARED